MNINNVYVAKIFVKTVEDLNENYLQDHKGDFVKNALVYEHLDSFRPCYIDLESGKKYTTFKLIDAHTGELYINIKAGLIPYTSLIENNKKNMSKRKILKKFNDYVENTNDIENSNK